MKSTDLRIGNWVQYDGIPYQIESLTKVDAVVHSIDIFDFRNRSLENAQPIELTEKLLYKIGFCFGGVSDYGKHYVKTNGNDTLWCKIYEDGDMSLTCNNNANLIQLHKVKFLHQLQNAYYCLTNKELEVKL